MIYQTNLTLGVVVVLEPSYQQLVEITFDSFHRWREASQTTVVQRTWGLEAKGRDVGMKEGINNYYLNDGNIL